MVLALLVGGYQLMNSRSFQLAGRLVNRVDTTEKVVALTLDDGPSERAPEVLDLLAAAGVPATFYLNGRDLAARPELGVAIAAAGHEIGNHTYSHRRMVLVSRDTVAAEVERTDAEIRETGYRGRSLSDHRTARNCGRFPAICPTTTGPRSPGMWNRRPRGRRRTISSPPLSSGCAPGRSFCCTRCTAAGRPRGRPFRALSPNSGPTATDSSRSPSSSTDPDAACGARKPEAERVGSGRGRTRTRRARYISPERWNGWFRHRGHVFARVACAS